MPFNKLCKNIIVPKELSKQNPVNLYLQKPDFRKLRHVQHGRTSGTEYIHKHAAVLR